MVGQQGKELGQTSRSNNPDVYRFTLFFGLDRFAVGRYLRNFSVTSDKRDDQGIAFFLM